MRNRLENHLELSCVMSVISTPGDLVGWTYGVMGMLARCREPSELPPGVAEGEGPSWDDFAALVAISLRNWSLFMMIFLEEEFTEKEDGRRCLAVATFVPRSSFCGW